MLRTFSILLAALAALLAAQSRERTDANDTASAWVAAMKKIHARFTGQKGTLAHFGDSITVTMAFWAAWRFRRIT